MRHALTLDVVNTCTKGISRFWDWDYSFGKYFLKPQAKSYIRKEVYQEWEMWWKPWLSWIAIMISVISLFVAFFRY